MSNIIYNYNQSSCNCYQHEDQKPPSGKPSSISLQGCNYSSHQPPFLKDNGSKIYNENIQFLNPQVFKIQNEITHDVRLTETARGIPTLLDRPPNYSQIKLDNINTDKSLNGFGKGYESYSDITGGQILYYKNNKKPFSDVLYSTPAKTTGFIYKDPMGNIKPIYYRDTIHNENPLSNQQNNNYFGGLSSINDTTNHREDLLSRQMAIMNQKDYELRWH
jgi:hypothetical protein